MELYLGDCLEVLPTLQENSVDLVLADPPYGITACKWDSVIPLEPLWNELKRVAKPNAAIVMMASQPFTTTLISSNPKMFKYCWVWRKPQGVDPFMSKKRPLNNIEDVVIFSQSTPAYNPQMSLGKPYHIIRDKTSRVYQVTGQVMRQTETKNKGERFPTRLIDCNQEKGLHPTQKPVALMEYLIKTYTNPGDTVLDFCMGSGTTGVAAQQCGRDFIGIEKDLDYFEIAKSRIEQAKAAA